MIQKRKSINNPEQWEAKFERLNLAFLGNFYARAFFFPFPFDDALESDDSFVAGSGTSPVALISLPLPFPFDDALELAGSFVAGSATSLAILTFEEPSGIWGCS